MMREILFNHAAVRENELDRRPLWVAADRLDAEALISEGLLATCNVGEAEVWNAECAQAVADCRHVLIAYRHDEPQPEPVIRRAGHERARRVYAELRAAGVKRIDFRRSPFAADVRTHLREGHELHELVAEAPELHRPSDGPADVFFDYARGPFAESSPNPDEPWRPIDVGAVLGRLESGAAAAPAPSLLAREDGHLLLYRGELHILAGEPEAGKGWLACEAAVQTIRAGGRVLYVDLEDGPESFISRLVALGLDAELIRAHFDYVGPASVPEDALTELPVYDYALVIIDAVSEACAAMGLNPDKGEDVAAFFKRLPRPLARCGAAVLLLDHVAKSKTERGRWPIGSQHKLAGVAAGYTLDSQRAPTRRSRGTATLKVAKDRHGHVGRRNQVIAAVEIVPENAGARVSVLLRTPGPGTSSANGEGTASTPLPERLQTVSRIIEQATTPPSSKILRKAVGGNGQAVDAAADWLLANGFIDTPVQSNRRQWSSVKPYRISS
jgi:hypothetical protein